MLNKKLIVCTWILLASTSVYANPDADGLGQTIQINTRLHSFVGKPSWLLIIRDIDHNQNIPYLFDVTRGKDFWIAFTFSRNYLITVSNLQFSPYKNMPWRSKRTNNFCHLESNGRIIRNLSISVTIEGALSPNTNGYTCHVSYFSNPNFTVVSPNS